MKPKARLPVPFSEQERDEIEAVMESMGFRNMSDFVRYAVLLVVRKGAQ